MIFQYPTELPVFREVSHKFLPLEIETYSGEFQTTSGLINRA